MEHPEFETLLERIRQNVDAFMADQDIQHLQDNEIAWGRLQELGLAQAAGEVFLKEAKAEMADAIARL